MDCELNDDVMFLKANHNIHDLADRLLTFCRLLELFVSFCMYDLRLDHIPLLHEEMCALCFAGGTLLCDSVFPSWGPDCVVVYV